MVVVDASALLDVLLGRSPEAEWVGGQLRRARGRVGAPQLVDVEVASALRGLVRGGHVTRSRAELALDDLFELRLERAPHARLLRRIWQLRDVLTANGAAYVALAEALDCPLVTTDAALARTTGHRARIVAPPATF